MRVLHLFDGRSTSAKPLTLGGAPMRLAMLADTWGRLGEIEQELLLVGGAAVARQARSQELTPFARIPGGGLGVLAVRAALGRHRRAPATAALHETGHDVVHAWSPAMVTVAAMLLPSTPRLLTATDVPSSATAKWVRVLTRDGPGRTVVLAASASIRRAYLRAGVDESAAHLVRPGVDMSRIELTRRDALRRGWGLDTNGPTTVLATLADHPRDVPAWRMLRLATQAVHHPRWPRERKMLVLLHPDQPGAVDAVHECAQWHPNLTATIETKVEPWRLLSGSDIGIALESAPTLCLGWAMAAGLPILATATYPVCEILEDRHSAMLVKPGDASAMASKLVEAALDRATAWTLRDTCRHEAYSYFPRTRYCETIARVYAQIADDQPVDVPEPTVTGGLRFHGRS
ncbi:MAG: hypothetical protein IT442_02660 [Phycisphaeraceae bacterium]|nr:hypothetical protein [Phycisphaeraceae bacterium]